jgi:hypothetical protein
MRQRTREHLLIAALVAVTIVQFGVWGWLVFFR